MNIIQQLISLLKKKDSALFGQIVRYLISGGLAFLLDVGTMIAFCELLHIREAVAASIGNFIGLVFTYLLSIFWIFDQRRYNNYIMEFLIFALIGLGGTLFTYGSMLVLVEKLHIHYIISKILTVVLVAIYAFIAKKIFLFRKKH